MPVDSVTDQLERIVETFGLGGAVTVQLERPRNPDHGDLSTNLALILAKRVGEKPQQLARNIIDRLDLAAAGLRAAEIAGPGFINFRFAHGSLQSKLLTILKDDGQFGRSQAEPRQRIQVEFVSANPTGPLHVAHGRGAALGDGIASLLEWVGHEMQREFYVNDAGVQMQLLGASLEARWREVRGEASSVPEGGYQGKYIADLAAQADAELGSQLAPMSQQERIDFFRAWGSRKLRDQQEADLREFHVYFDEFYSET